MADLSQKKPLVYSLPAFMDKKAADRIQSQTRGIPCHVVKVEKDFVTVAFDTHNDVFTPPTVKIPQAFSRYQREPTQVGDKGLAVPSDYYLGGVDGNGGGATNYYQRGNLTALVFQPLATTSFNDRDPDRHVIVGGPKGVSISSASYQSGDGAVRQTTTGEQSSITIDENKVVTVADSHGNSITIDPSTMKVAINAKGAAMIYLGGTGKRPELYDFVMTASGQSVNVKAKFVAEDD